MAKDLNRCMFTGRLAANPEGRYTPGGSLVVTFRIAANRRVRGSDGEWYEEAEWVRCVAWEQLGEVANDHLGRGDRVYVEGRMQTRKWRDQSGADRYMTEIILSEIIFLDVAGFGEAQWEPGEVLNADEGPEEEQLDPTVPPPGAESVRAQTPPPAARRAAPREDDEDPLGFEDAPPQRRPADVARNIRASQPSRPAERTEYDERAEARDRQQQQAPQPRRAARDWDSMQAEAEQYQAPPRTRQQTGHNRPAPMNARERAMLDAGQAPTAPQAEDGQPRRFRPGR